MRLQRSASEEHGNVAIALDIANSRCFILREGSLSRGHAEQSRGESPAGNPGGRSSRLIVSECSVLADGVHSSAFGTNKKPATEDARGLLSGEP
jgi:hypothetical protein